MYSWRQLSKPILGQSSNFPIFGYCDKKVKVNQMLSFAYSWKNSSIQRHIPSFRTICELVLEEKIFRSFYHIKAWRPYWLCDLDDLDKILFPLPLEAPYEVLLQFAQWLLRRWFKSSKYERPGSKGKGWPWHIVLTNLHEHIWKLSSSIFEPKSWKRSMKSYVPAFPIFDLAIKRSR